MRSVKLFLFTALLAFAASASAATDVRSQSATPPAAQLDQYPLQTGPLSVDEEARLNLRPVKLEESWTGYNYYRALRGDGRWVLEALPAGTLVLADDDGNPIYRVSCGNRLVSVRNPKPIVCPLPVEGFWNQHPLLQKFLDFLKWIGWILLGALFLTALLLLLGWLFNLLREEFGRWSRSPREKVPATPPVAASAPLVAPAAPAQPSTPASVVSPSTDRPAVEVASEASAPSTPASPPAPASAPTRRYMAFYRGVGQEPHKVKLVGHDHVSVADNGTEGFTIRFK